MNTNQQKIKKLLETFLKEKEVIIINNGEIENFKNIASLKNIPNDIINQLIEFYEISNGIPCVNSFDFHSCNDEILYEWWDEKILWIGQKDDDILRWCATNGKFCLGDASNNSYGNEYEFKYLIDLLEKSFKEWGYSV